MDQRLSRVERWIDRNTSYDFSRAVIAKKKIETYFSLDEMDDLCFDMGIDPGKVAGDSKSVKARELVGYMTRRGRLDELITRCQELRPRVKWPY